MKPTITISTLAYAKIQHMLKESTEIGAFGLSRQDSPLHIVDLGFPHQTVSGGSVDFDDDKIAQYVDEMYLQGWEPCESCRIWIHTHPQGVNKPSGTDEATFAKIFGNYDWAVMLIFPKKSQPYARLQTTFPVPFSAEATVEVLYPEVNIDAILTERVKKQTYQRVSPADKKNTTAINDNDYHTQKNALDQAFQSGHISDDEYGVATENLGCEQFGETCSYDLDEDDRLYEQYLTGQLTYNDYILELQRKGYY